MDYTKIFKTDEKILEGTGIVWDSKKNKEIVNFVEIKEENPLYVFKPFGNTDGTPLYMNEMFENLSELGKPYCNEIKTFKEKETFIHNEFFSFYKTSRIKAAHSNTRWYIAKIWGVVFIIDTNEIMAQNCNLIEKINFSYVELHPMSAVYILEKRKDLTNNEIFNCKQRLLLNSYTAFNHILFSKKFDFYIYKNLSNDEYFVKIIQAIKRKEIAVDKDEVLKLIKEEKRNQILEKKELGLDYYGDVKLMLLENHLNTL